MLRSPVVLVRVFSEQEAGHIRELGGHPVVEAELAAEALLNWHAAVKAAANATGPSTPSASPIS